MNKVEIYEKKNKIPYNKSFIKRVVKSIFEKENIEKYEISIAYLSKDDLRKLNKKFRKKDRTTNVLSFLYENKQKIFGEVIISDFHVVEKNEDFLKLMIHGLLHLIGYNHEKKEEKEKMFEKEIFYYNLFKK